MLASLCVVSIGTVARAAPSATGAMAQGAGEQRTRYYGAPDLALTAALVQAGGGAEHFDAGRLVGVLAGTQQKAEVGRLTAAFGAQRVARFLHTLTFGVNDVLAVAKKKNIALPAPAPGLATDGGKLSASLLRSGTMPSGRFDIGYMLEHLVSRPLHVQMMQDIDADPRYGLEINADCHMILTTAMTDLKSEYGL